MTAIATAETGRRLAAALGIEVLGTEGHDLKCPCIACDSTKKMRIKIDDGAAQCWVCDRKWSAFGLAEAVLGDRDRAIDLMLELGVYKEDYRKRNGTRNGKATSTAAPEQTATVKQENDTVTAPPVSPAPPPAPKKPPPPYRDAIEWLAGIKHCPADALRKYGATLAPNHSTVWIPTYDPYGKAISRQTFVAPFDGDHGKGRNAPGKKAGLFLPGGQVPKPGETWMIVEGCKDAAALWGTLKMPTVGLCGNRASSYLIQNGFAEMFAGVTVYMVPDRDVASESGLRETARTIHPHAAAVHWVDLPIDTPKADTRDVLQLPDGADKLAKAFADARPVGRDGEPIDVPRFETLTCAELLAADYQIRFLIERILVAGQPCIMAGPKKSLKTSTLLDLALALATGGQFLGKFRAPEPVPVGMMTGESGLPVIQETVRRIAADTGASETAANLKNLVFTDRVPTFTNSGHLQAVTAFIAGCKLAALIIDPAYMCLDGTDASNLMAMGAQLRPMAEICQAAGCTMILCHHTRKNLATPYAAPELEDIAWAGFQEFARQWILLNRRERYAPGSGEHRLWLSVGGSVGFGGLWGVDIEEGCYDDVGGRVWKVTVPDLEEIKQGAAERKQAERDAKVKAQLDEDREKVARALAKFPDGETKRRIRDITVLKTSRLDPVFAAMIDASEIVCCQITKNGRKYDAHKLAE